MEKPPPPPPSKKNLAQPEAGKTSCIAQEKFTNSPRLEDPCRIKFLAIPQPKKGL